MTDLVRSLFFLACNYSSLFLVQATIFYCKSTDPCGCSRNNVDINLDVIRGESVAYRSWGWAISVRDSSGMHICGGTIISKSFILTAAHCFIRISEEYFPYSVFMGIDTLDSTAGHIRLISHVFLHPKWNFTSQENDIALLKLNGSIPTHDVNIAKICLPDVIEPDQVHYPPIHSSLIAIGWGITAWEDLISPMYLRQVLLETVDSTESKCSHIIKNFRLQFCAAIQGRGKDTCEGNSGGPIMHFSTAKRRWILTGIISYGYRCGLRDYIGVYTRISVYIDWIRLIVGNDGIVTVTENLACTHHRSHIIVLLLLLFFIYLSHVYKL